MRFPLSISSWVLSPSKLALIVVGVAVCVLHLWVLRGAPRWLGQGTGMSELETASSTTVTRILPPSTPNQETYAPNVVEPPRKQAAPPLTPPPTLPPSEAQTLPAPASTLASVPEPPSQTPVEAAAPEMVEPAVSLDNANQTASESAPTTVATRFAFPPPASLRYDVVHTSSSGVFPASAELNWQHDGAQYQLSLAVRKFGFSLRSWTSLGALSTLGLEPQRFGDKTRSELAAHFVRDKDLVIFSANTPSAILLPGAQDQLSAIFQLASMLAADPGQMLRTDTLSFQAISARQSEVWTFVLGPLETKQHGSTSVTTYKLTKDFTQQYSTKAEIWFAPAMQYLPVHIRLSETNGNVLDMELVDLK